MLEKPLYSVDLFSGCGGLALGFKQAGISPLLFSEVNSHAAATFELNLGGRNVEKVGGIDELTTSRIKSLLARWKGEGKTVDIVTGGPPCQGYSRIGHRRAFRVERNVMPSNHLFREMVRVIRAIQPRAFLFENVQGLISGRWTAQGKKGEIWADVRETFGNLRGYDIGWQLVHAKSFGVPQNRPRVLLVGIRRDVNFLLEAGDDSHVSHNPRGLLPSIGAPPPNLIDVLSDLDDPRFAIAGENTRYLREPQSDFQDSIRRDRQGRLLRAGAPLTEQTYTKHSRRVAEKFEHMLRNGEIPPDSQTKKFAQRVLPAVWGEDGPTITVTSLPDDFVHYRRPRILTVREWARLQTFPDWFRFVGPRTTGGHRRAGIPTLGVWTREVPRYTQIGNAVPVGLARAIGIHLAQILREA